MQKFMSTGPALRLAMHATHVLLHLPGHANALYMVRNSSVPLGGVAQIVLLLLGVLRNTGMCKDRETS